MKSHADIITSFFNGATSGKGSRVFIDRDGLYSYGHHFYLAIRRTEDDGKVWYLLNADKYSISTSKHQSLTFRRGNEYPRVSFRALHAANLQEKTAKLVDFTRDDYKYFDETDHIFNSLNATSFGLGYQYNTVKNKQGEIISKAYHKVGGVVLENPYSREQWLCAMDEGGYFISKLPHRVKTVAEAFDALKPKAIKEAEKSGIKVLRQGEYFFVPMPNNDLPIKPSWGIITSTRNTSEQINAHVSDFIPRKLIKGIVPRNCLGIATGQVKHIRKGTFEIKGKKGRITKEHATLKLGNIPHEVYINTSLADYSGLGRVD